MNIKKGKEKGRDKPGLVLHAVHVSCGENEAATGSSAPNSTFDMFLNLLAEVYVTFLGFIP